MEQPDCNIIRPVIIISVARKVSFCLEIHSHAFLIAYHLHLGVLYSRQGIHHMRKSCDSCCEGSADIGIDQCHLRCFIVILVMHVLDQVQSIYIESCQPVHHDLIFADQLIIFQIFGGDRFVFRSNLHS